MALILDTDRYDPRDRVDVVATAVQESTAPSHVVVQRSGGVVHARYHRWQFGQVGLQRSSNSGLGVTRTPKQIRSSSSPGLLVIVQTRGTTRLTYPDTQYEASAGRLFVMYLDLPYSVDWRGGESANLIVPTDKIDLPIETIRAALSGCQHSPLYDMTANSIVLLANSADELERDFAAPELGDSLAQLTRTFLMSAAARGNEDGTSFPEDILMTQIRDYVQRRLSDPNLSPAEVARDHNISVRHMYKVFARAGFSLEQWIIDQRLARVHSDLALASNRHRSIAAIGYSHGLRDPSHLTRRFRATYGITPSQWRKDALERPDSTESGSQSD
ncbi:helix-turn-helix domain-containing protein [Nocardia sp. NPDC049149]|uniref:helix-turn-helix domain-containing protein n=1 Tax=Nocardia sp. NPDC049149 TaxID=3364315 RepID=UPI003717CC9C